MMKMRLMFIAMGLVLVALSSSHAALHTGFLTTADGGLYSDGQTWASPPGIRVNWEVSQSSPSIWHYKYTFNNESGGELGMLVSHMIISLSDNIEESDLSNFGSDVDQWGLGTFGPTVSNPGFPSNESIFGVKIDMGGAQLVAEFDSTRVPMWGDFYAKDGGNPMNYAYSSDFGIVTQNLHDYTATLVDVSDNVLHKILVPNSIPEPMTMALFGFGGLLLSRKR